ncbi:unnamed protein product [Owenia fusiformis]|uniref:Gem-associated protein 5 TPR domain-containing protein n=1 Tax=Owenia fusiformis TaxID=6347 RepID=A0A8S4N936_OWEFU|nr:unnamed protein product [Owenia fusiformis]
MGLNNVVFIVDVSILIILYETHVKIEGSQDTYFVYSCGDGVILQHDPYKLQEQAHNINDLIQQTNDIIHKFPIRSEITWKQDFSVVAIGNDDGSVEVFRPPDMKLLCSIQVHRKLVNCLRWHPMYTQGGSTVAEQQYWLASGSNESMIHVVNLSKILSEADPAKSALSITQSFCQLEGHCDRITNLSWSTHSPGLLVSASYDGTAQVWNVLKNEPICNYRGHHGRLLCVQWSGIDDDVIYTGADDFTVQAWRVSQQPYKIPPEKSLLAQQKKVNKAKKRAKGRGPNQGQGQSPYNQVQGQSPGKPPINKPSEEMKELEKLLEEKRKQLMFQDIPDGNKDAPIAKNEKVEPQGPSVPASVNNVQIMTRDASKPVPTPDHTSQPSDQQASEGSHEDIEIIQDEISQDELQLAKRTIEPKEKWKRRKGRSLFPTTGVLENRGKVASQEDCVTLAKLLYTNKIPVDSVPLTQEIKDTDTKVQDAEGVDDVTNAQSAKEVDNVAKANGAKGNHDVIKVGDVSGVTDAKEEENIIPGVGPNSHLGLFVPERAATYGTFKQEEAYHLEQGNIEQFILLELWKGNVSSAIKMAAQNNQLSDWLVSMAPMVSHKFWLEMLGAYGRQLSQEGNYHRAATYYIAANRIYDALEMLKQNNLFREAVAIAKVRLSPMDPVLGDIYIGWAQSLARDGNYEQSAKCYLAAKQPINAARILSKRADQSGLLAATHVTLLANEIDAGKMYGLKYVHESLLRCDWLGIEALTSQYQSLKAYRVYGCTHEVLLGMMIERGVVQGETIADIHPSKVAVNNRETAAPLIDISVPTDSTLAALGTGVTVFYSTVLNLWNVLDLNNVEGIYKDLLALEQTHQTQTSIPQVLIQCAVNISLSLLALLLGNSIAFRGHLEVALLRCHHTASVALLQNMISLLLPKGPFFTLVAEFGKQQHKVTLTKSVTRDTEMSKRVTHGNRDANPSNYDSDSSNNAASLANTCAVPSNDGSAPNNNDVTPSSSENNKTSDNNGENSEKTVIMVPVAMENKYLDPLLHIFLLATSRSIKEKYNLQNKDGSGDSSNNVSTRSKNTEHSNSDNMNNQMEEDSGGDNTHICADLDKVVDDLVRTCVSLINTPENPGLESQLNDFLRYESHLLHIVGSL